MTSRTMPVLWRALKLVAPGQPLAERWHGALGLPGRVRADLAHARSAIEGLEPGGERQLAVFGDRSLEPESDSASHRLGWLLRLAIGDGYRVSFYSVRQRRWFGVDSALALSTAQRPGRASVAWVVRPEAAAAVLPALTEQRPGLRVVYDTMDLHYLRLERESAVTGSRGLRLQARLMKALEGQACSHADVAVAISDEEAPLLRRLAGSTQVAVLPNVHLPRHDEAPPPEARSGLLFVGNYTHTPNVDAVQTLVREVMPRLWARRPELVVSIAGRGLAAGELPPADDRVRVLGWVDDLDALVDRSAALVAPLRFGGGLKGKIGFALARGLPVVTTWVGAEGFPGRAGMLTVSDGDWDAFAARTLDLLDDAELWLSTSLAGLDLTRREFAPAVLASRLRQILEEA